MIGYTDSVILGHDDSPRQPVSSTASSDAQLQPVGEYRQGEDHEPMLHCPVCSQKLLARKCKLYCSQCGYYMSCADYI